MSLLLEWVETRQQRPIAHVAHSVHGHFPALQARAAALQQVALAAAR